MTGGLDGYLKNIKNAVLGKKDQDGTDEKKIEKIEKKIEKIEKKIEKKIKESFPDFVVSTTQVGDTFYFIGKQVSHSGKTVKLICGEFADNEFRVGSSFRIQQRKMDAHVDNYGEKTWLKIGKMVVFRDIPKSDLERILADFIMARK